jgi:integrase
MFGDLPCIAVEHSDIAAVMANQPNAGKHPASAGTRNHVHSHLSRIFSLSEVPLNLRRPGTNPVLPAYRAPRDQEKRFNFLYPAEVLALLANRNIPLGRRIAYLLDSYFGWRKGTLLAFKWSGVDWTHGTVSVLHQKGRQRLDARESDEHGMPIFFRVEPRCVLDALHAWWERCGKPAGDEAVIRDIRSPGEPWDHEAGVLRTDLRASGVTRETLFTEASNVQKIRFHDGRATFCTWARRAGRSDLWITERTGHTPTSAMLRRYTRMAQTLADLGYEPFPDVTGAIPELAPTNPSVCDDCAARASSTSVSTATPTGAKGIAAQSSGPRNEAGRDHWVAATALEVLAGNTVRVQVPPFAH